jgi:hypothetical protein
MRNLSGQAAQTPHFMSGLKKMAAYLSALSPR